MVPEKLQLRNFMCYGEDVPPLQFDGIRIACLSGENGVGKSAMLDAITWALWGQARARSDDDLIMLGRDEMEVVFEFELDQQLYRVIRRRKRGKRGVTTLDFQVREREAGWNRLTGDTIAETQCAINRVLRMEYDTFINSAFLLQGRADEFASRKPAERKQVLVDILGLADYEVLERRAKDAANKRSKDLDVVQSHILRLQSEVAQRPELEQHVAEAQDQIVTVEEEFSSYEADIQELHEQVARLRELNAQHQALARQIERQEQEYHGLERALAAHRKRLAEYEAVITRRKEIDAGCTRLQTQREALREMDRRAEERNRLKDELRHWERELDKLRHQILAEQHMAEEQLARLDAQIARHTQVMADREQVGSQLATFATLQAELNQMYAQERLLLDQQATLYGLQLQIKELEGTIELRRQALHAAQLEQQRQVNELEVQAKRLPEIQHDLDSLQQEIQRLDTLAAELAVQRELLAAAERRFGELQAEQKQIEADGKQIADKLKLVEQGQGECPVCHSELGEAGLDHIRQYYIDERNVLRERIRHIRRAISKTEATIDEQRRLIERLQAETEARTQLEARRAQLEMQQAQALAAQDKLAATQQMLVATEHRIAQKEYAHDEQAQLAVLQAKMREFGDLDSVGQQLATLRQAIDTASRRLEQASHLQQRLAQLDAELAAIALAEAERPAAFERYQALEVQLQNEAYGERERRERDRIIAEGQALGYDKQQHDQLRVEVDQLTRWEHEARLLGQALAEVDDERDQMRHSEELLVRYQADMAEAREQVSILEQQVRDLPGVEAALRQMEQHMRTLRSRLDAAQSTFGRAEAELRRCEECAQELVRQQARVAVLADECAVYEELAQAFGKKGIQTMLIETAIPEIEREANELLSRMTDNQLQIAFETQRDTKKGDSTIETLDIRISDMFGTRDYDMYSGGEAFRVNFALRIALSKLLARRAGASLKTLIVDEGFGTQDTKGRDRIIEAINAIEGEFERILVITHIQELKDMFQSQIEITKTIGGSTWTII